MNPHVMSMYPTQAECIQAREAWFKARIAALQKAVEFAGYMATTAERFQTAANGMAKAIDGDDCDETVIEQARESYIEFHRALTNDIYEFRKMVPA
jgi:hypothetical protein